MFEDDAAYYRRRAEKQLDLAQRAIEPEAVRAHHYLAEAYLERLSPDTPVSGAAST